MVDEGTDPASVRASAVRFRWWAVVWSILFAAALLVLYVVAVRTYVGQVVDVTVYQWSLTLNRGGGLSAAIRSGLYLPLLLIYLVLAVIALRARRWRALAASLIVLAATPLASLLLRHLVFDRPYLGDHAFLMNTLPSGHVSLSAAIAVAIVLLWPSRAWWPIVAAAALITAASLASVVAHAHRPSDVVASVLLTGAVTGAALASVGALAAPLGLRRAAPAHSARTSGPSSSAGWLRREGSALSTDQRKPPRPAPQSPDRSGTRPSGHR